MRSALALLICLAITTWGCSFGGGSDSASTPDKEPAQKSAPELVQQPVQQSAQQPAQQPSQASASGAQSGSKAADPLCGPDVPPPAPEDKTKDASAQQSASAPVRDHAMPEKTSATSPYKDDVPGNAPAPQTGGKDDTHTTAALPPQAKQQDGQADSAQAAQADGLAPAEPEAYRSPFSLYPTRGFSIQRGALKTVTKQPAPGDLVVEAKACDFISSQKQGQKGGDLEAFKKTLLDKAREDAAYLLFTRFYSGQTQLGLQGQLPLQYQKAVADRVQFQGDPNFYNGDVFGELCVKVTATLPPETLDVVSPVIATLENFCLQEGGLDEGALMGKATSAALDRIIQNIAPGSQPPAHFRQDLLNDAVINGRLGGPGNNTYCLDMRVEVSPLELGVYVPKTAGPAKSSGQAAMADTLAANTDPAFSLDLSKYSPGDVASEYGANLAVYQDVNGKSLGSLSREDALAVIPVKAGQDFSLRVLVQKESQYDFLHSETVELFRLHFDNKAWERAAFVMSLDDDNNPVAEFRTRTSSSDTFPWTNAANFNDCYLVKQGGQMKFFFNGVFLLAYPTKGGALTEVRVPLKWNERLYNVIVKNP